MTARLRTPALLLLIAVLGAASALAVNACTCQGKRSSQGTPLLTAPFDQITSEDLLAAVAQAGWSDATATRSQSDAVSSITVYARKEHPQGEATPEGKKVVQVIVALAKLPPEGADVRARGMQEVGVAFRREGDFTLSVHLSNGDAAEAQKVLALLVGQ